MKLHRTLFLCSLTAMLSMGACTSEDPLNENKEQEEQPKKTETQPEETGGEILRLEGSGAQKVKLLLPRIAPERSRQMGRISISETEYKEIATFTQSLVKGLKTEKEKFNSIYDWIRKNIKYELGDNRPYAVFKNKQAVCQGYADLLKVMCHTQHISAFVTNGFLNMGRVWGGHAWNYVRVDGKWIVADPTNGPVYDIDETEKYEKDLIPQSLDGVLFSDDDFEYGLIEEMLAATNVKQTQKKRLTVPDHISGIEVTCFNPQSAIPGQVEEIVLGKRIQSLGGETSMGLLHYGIMLTDLIISKDNPHLENYKGAVYPKKGEKTNIPLYIPGKVKRVELKPIKFVDKNLITRHNGLEELIFAEGTEEINDYAIENCPKLRTIWIPASLKQRGENAFIGSHPSLIVKTGKP